MRDFFCLARKEKKRSQVSNPDSSIQKRGQQFYFLHFREIKSFFSNGIFLFMGESPLLGHNYIPQCLQHTYPSFSFAKRRPLFSRLPSCKGELKEDYEFRRVIDNAAITFSQLFAEGKNTLVIYSFMFAPDADLPCPSCNSLADSFDGNALHLSDRINFYIVAKAPVPVGTV